MYYLEFASPPNLEIIDFLLSAGNKAEMERFDKWGDPIEENNNVIHHLARNPKSTVEIFEILTNTDASCEKLN